MKKSRDLIEIVNVVSTLNQLKSTLSLQLETKDELKYLTNIKGRLREIIFCHIANVNDYLVIGTVNKIEFNIGYFLKNSSMFDVLPLVDFNKTQIRNMLIELGFATNFIKKKASGCIYAENAEDEWGIPEDILDRIVNDDFEDIPQKYLVRYKKYFENSMHKRKYPPIYRR